MLPKKVDGHLGQFCSCCINGPGVKTALSPTEFLQKLQSWLTAKWPNESEKISLFWPLSYDRRCSSVKKNPAKQTWNDNALRAAIGNGCGINFGIIFLSFWIFFGGFAASIPFPRWHVVFWDFSLLSTGFLWFYSRLEASQCCDQYCVRQPWQRM